MNSCLLSTGSKAGATASATAHHRYSTPDLLYVRQDTHAALLAEQPEAVYFLATLIPVNSGELWIAPDRMHYTDSGIPLYVPLLPIFVVKRLSWLCSCAAGGSLLPAEAHTRQPRRALDRCRQRAPHRQQQTSTCAPPTNRPRRGHVNLPVADQPAAAPGGHFWQAQNWCMTNHCES